MLFSKSKFVKNGIECIRGNKKGRQYSTIFTFLMHQHLLNLF